MSKIPLRLILSNGNVEPVCREQSERGMAMSVEAERWSVWATGVVRKARIGDVPTVHKMLEEFAGDGRLLSRSLGELYTNLRDCFVALDGETQAVVGCCSLHIMWDNLAEVRSLAVQAAHHKKGLGRMLVSACIDEARELGISRLFALTYEVEFFRHMGFRVVEKSIFPQKIWADCLHCPKFPQCDETALVMDLS